MPQSNPEPRTSSTGQRAVLLEHIAAEVVRLHKQFWGRGPESAKAHAVDDLVFVVLRGGETTAERTQLDAGRQDMVRATRQQFQNDMADHFTAAVELLTGRTVRTYQSQILFDPVVVVEIFALDRPI